MIIASRWAFKKYKTDKRAKEERAQAESTKHDQLLQSAQDEISNSPIEQLRASSDSEFRNDPPPLYSGATVASPRTPSTPSTTTRRDDALQSTLCQPPTSSPPSLAFAPGQEFGPSTEIEIRGKWVWVPDAAPFPSRAQSHEKGQFMSVETHSALELPASNVLQELDDTSKSEVGEEELSFVELDGKGTSAADIFQDKALEASYQME